MKRFIIIVLCLGIMLQFQFAYPVHMIDNMVINNLYIKDISSNQLATALTNNQNYELWICVKNTNDNDTIWYEKAQLRVVPLNNKIQFYTDDSYNSSISRFDSIFFDLQSKQSRWFIIPFRWTGSANVSADSQKFDIGIYAHPMKIINGWRKLHHPI